MSREIENKMVTNNVNIRATLMYNREGRTMP